MIFVPKTLMTIKDGFLSPARGQKLNVVSYIAVVALVGCVTEADSSGGTRATITDVGGAGGSSPSEARPGNDLGADAGPGDREVGTGAEKQPLVPTRLDGGAPPEASPRPSAGTDCDCGSVDPADPCIAEQVAVSYELRGETKQVTFEFERPVACGRFVSGRLWVAPLSEGDALHLVDTLPKKVGSAGQTRNGLMADVTTMDFGGFPFTGSGRAFSEDHAIETPHSFDTASFSKNDLGIGSYTLFKGVSHPEHSVIDAEADPSRKCSNHNRMCEEGIFSLTLLSAPPGDVFAPPFFGEGGPMVAASDFNEALVPNLAPVEDMVSFEAAYKTLRFARVTNAHRDLNSRESHYGEANVNGGRGYPGYWLQGQWAAVMRVATEPATAAEAELKLEAARALAQQAIDLYAIFAEGGDKGSLNTECGAWIANGGFGQGRLGMIIIGLSLIEKAEWLTKISGVMASSLGKQCFGESMIVQPPNPEGRNVPLFGALSSAAYAVSKTNKTAGDPSGWLDASGNAQAKCGSAYQPIVTGGFIGEAMAVLSFPAAYKNWPASFDYFFDFMKRTYPARSPGTAYALCDRDSNDLKEFKLSFMPAAAANMWQKYYACGLEGNCPGF